jgi:hypothetical protein
LHPGGKVEKPKSQGEKNRIMPRIKSATSQSFALDQSSITASRFSAGAAADPAPRSVRETSKCSRGSTPGVLASREQATISAGATVELIGR